MDAQYVQINTPQKRGTKMAATFDFSHFPVIETERLRLRQMTHDDAEAVMALFGDPRMLEFLNDDPVDTREKATGLIDWLNGHFNAHKGLTWGVTLRHEDQMIGTAGWYGWDREHRRADIGYHILPAYWGQGYATEAAHAVVDWCFRKLDLHRIQADCTDGNIGSERVMLKCGFRLEGIWRESCWEHGRFVNIKQFGLLRREFMPTAG
jgi:[ribosomal protein S5]-alanine N-acetyltransferase